MEEARGQLSTQGSAQKDRAAAGLRQLGDEFSRMAAAPEAGNGTASTLVQQTGAKVDATAGWLEEHDPVEVLDEVREFGRRRPGMFLLAAAAAGVVAGRITRGVVDESRTGGESSGAQTVPASAGPGRATGMDGDGLYGTGTAGVQR